MKILVVDDSTSMRQMIEFTLQTSSHEVKCVEDGAAALDAAKSDSFDLVLTDVNMPEMNGYEFTQALRQQESYGGVPIIMLTTESDNESKQCGKEAGATGWLLKPFDPEKLLRIVGRFDQ